MKICTVLIALAALTGLDACNKKSPRSEDELASPAQQQASREKDVTQGSDDQAARRERMVREQLMKRDIDDARVLEAMGTVPRHEFVPEDVRDRAYTDSPLPIGERQTISQPYIVALMTQLAEIDADSRVLEIGTGSGYQAAILAEIARQVYTIEIVEPLGKRAGQTLTRLGYKNIHFRIGDGYRGWPEAAPFDAIIVTAAPPRVPEPLKAQLAVGGTLVVPVGRHFQSLRVIKKTPSGFEDREVASVLFVPMTGEAQK